MNCAASVLRVASFVAYILCMMASHLSIPFHARCLVAQAPATHERVLAESTLYRERRLGETPLCRLCLEVCEERDFRLFLTYEVTKADGEALYLAGRIDHVVIHALQLTHKGLS